MAQHSRQVQLMPPFVSGTHRVNSASESFSTQVCFKRGEKGERMIVAAVTSAM